MNKIALISTIVLSYIYAIEIEQVDKPMYIDNHKIIKEKIPDGRNINIDRKTSKKDGNTLDTHKHKTERNIVINRDKRNISHSRLRDRAVDDRLKRDRLRKDRLERERLRRDRKHRKRLSISKEIKDDKNIDIKINNSDKIDRLYMLIEKIEKSKIRDRNDTIEMKPTEKKVEIIPYRYIKIGDTSYVEIYVSIDDDIIDLSKKGVKNIIEGRQSKVTKDVTDGKVFKYLLKEGDDIENYKVVKITDRYIILKDMKSGKFIKKYYYF